MSQADLEVHEQDGAALRRQRTVWAVVLLLVAALLVVRALVGTTVEGGAPGQEAPARTMHMFGLAYVQEESKHFVPVMVPDAETNGVKETWQAAEPGQVGGITWTEWKRTTPRAYVEAVNTDPGQQRVQLSWQRTLGIWLAAFFTLAAFSFLIRDNPAYKFTEAVVVGVSAAYWMVVAFWDTLVPKLMGGLAPVWTKANLMPAIEEGGAKWLMLIPLVLGIMLLCRLNRYSAWLGVFPLGFIVGTFAGLRFVQYVQSDLLAQVATMFRPLVVQVREGVDGTGAIEWASTIGGSISAILVFVGVLSVLVYFFFSLEHKGAVGKTARVGIWYLMITFGASFGLTVMGRIALLAARFEYLLDDWLWITDPSSRH